MGLMTEAEALAALREKGALYFPQEGYHFVGISGKHLSGYCNIDPILPHSSIVSRMAESIVNHFKDDGVETVFVPATGAIPFAGWGSYHLEKMGADNVLGVWADKVKPRGFKVERDGFVEAINGRRVLILEDMINRMYSVGELIKLVKERGGELVGVGAVVSNRDASARAMGASKFVTLCMFGYETWDEGGCELCVKRVPMVVDIGHGDEFAADHPSYPTVRLRGG